MDILSKLKSLKSKALGSSKRKSLAMILGGALCLLVGVTAKHFTGKNDSSAEQVAEAVLEAYYNINIDFSDDDVPDEIAKPSVKKDVD